MRRMAPWGPGLSEESSQAGVSPASLGDGLDVRRGEQMSQFWRLMGARIYFYGENYKYRERESEDEPCVV